MFKIRQNLHLILALVLYLVILWLRIIQGGWEPKIDLFKLQRQALDEKISQFLPSPDAQLVSGVLLGQNKSLPGELKLALRDTSTIHIVVASGQNLSMVAGFFLAFAGLVKRKIAITFGLLAVIFYTLLTGFQVPIMRAAVMFGLACLAQLTGRQRDGVWVLLVTGGLMLLINPKWLTDISFQLSFLATFGVIVLAPVFLKRLDKIPLIGQDLAVSLSAQLMVTPVIIQNFHQFSVVGIAANLLILWTIPFMMILGAAVLAAGFISGLLGSLIAWPLLALTRYFIYIVEFFGHLPFSWEYVGGKIWIFWVGYYLILAAVMLSLKNGQREAVTGSETGG